MIELTFNTADGPVMIQFHTPVPRQDDKWPWGVEVRINGRPPMLVGGDPVAALEMATRFVSSYLSGTEGLDPNVDPPWPFAPKVPDKKGDQP